MSQSVTTRPAYKVEELLALRGSAAGSSVSLEKFPDEDVIKEHVLKSSVSNPGLSVTGENARPPPIGMNGFTRFAPLPARNPAFTTSAIKRPSPTPSIKRSKAERLLKDHGSPPNVRVTAGGRIVPTDFTPLGSPRFPFAQPHRPYDRIQAPVGFHVPHRNAPYANMHQPAHAKDHGWVAYNQDGQICQLLDGQWLPVPYGPSGELAFFIAPTNLPFPSFGARALQPHVTQPMGMMDGTSYASPPIAVPSMLPPAPVAQTNVAQVSNGDIASQIQALQNEYEGLRQQKIEYERHEVKLSDQLTQAEKAAIVKQKCKFVTDLDAIRKRIKQLESAKSSGVLAGAVNAPLFMQPVNPADMVPPFLASLPMPAAAPNMLSMNGVKEFEWPGMPRTTVATNAATVNNKVEDVHHHVSASETSPTSRAPRRSHAIEIKDPNTHKPVNDLSSSALNPTSPSYEPGKPFPLNEGSPPAFVVPAPSPIDTPNMPTAELAKQYPWVFGNDNEDSVRARSAGMEQSSGGTIMDDGHDQHDHTPSQHQTSQSSVTTTDFFPLNTHEHSFGKYMLRKASGGIDHPATPQRNYQDEFISPMSTQQHYGNGTQVSPVDHADFRMSSFLRSVALPMPTPEVGFNRVSWLSTDSAKYFLGNHFANASGQSPPTNDADVQNEFHGKSALYLEGYIAATACNLPRDPLDPDYVEGYIHGLRFKAAGGRPPPVERDSRSTSTVSLKSQGTRTHSKTPPETSDRSLTSLAAGFNLSSAQRENVRLTQSATHLPTHPGFTQNVPSASTARQATTSSFPADQTRNNNFSQYGIATTNFAPLDRALNEARLQNKSYSSSDNHQDTIWEHARPVPSSFAPRGKDTITGAPAPSWRERTMSANQSSNLMGYSGNRHESAANRVTSAPHLGEIYGEDKYGFTSFNESHGKIDSKFTHTTRRSGGDRSANSQLDGAMDDLADMVTPPKVNASASKARSSVTRDSHQSYQSHQSAAGTIGSHRPSASVEDSAQRSIPVSVTHHTDNHARFNTDPVSPPSSPSKSHCSPKKLASPKHRIQQIARGMLGQGGDRSGSDRSAGPASRPESPDPKKMGNEEKRRWKEEWRTKFSQLKNKEQAEIKKYRQEHP